MSNPLGPDVFLIQHEPPGKCEMCGKVDELRPYGPNGENVCFACGMKDKKAAERQFSKRLGNRSILYDPDGHIQGN